MLNEEERLRIDMLSYRYLPSYYIRIAGATDKEWIEIVKRQKKQNRKEKFIDFIAILFLAFGWIFCITASIAMMQSWYGALFFIPAIICAFGLKKLPMYI